MSVLDIRTTGAFAILGHADQGENLVGHQRGGEHAAEEVTGLDLARAIRPLHCDRGIQTQDSAGIVRCWVGVGQRTADCAAVAYHLVADLCCCFSQNSAIGFDRLRSSDTRVSR